MSKMPRSGGGRYCAVLNCKNSSSNSKEKGVSFHKFPVNQSYLKRWLSVIWPNTNKRPTKWTRVCSDHFSDKDFYSRSSDAKVIMRRLKFNAVPSLKLGVNINSKKHSEIGINIDDPSFQDATLTKSKFLDDSGLTSFVVVTGTLVTGNNEDDIIREVGSNEDSFLLNLVQSNRTSSFSSVSNFLLETNNLNDEDTVHSDNVNIKLEPNSDSDNESTISPNEVCKIKSEPASPESTQSVSLDGIKDEETEGSSLEMLQNQVLEYQLLDKERFSTWSIMNTANTITFSKMEQNGTVSTSIRINDKLNVKLFVYQKIVPPEHDIFEETEWNSVEYVWNILDLLALVNSWKLCQGNSELEITEFGIYGEFNWITKGFHSKNCDLIFSNLNSDRCLQCNALRYSIIGKKI